MDGQDNAGEERGFQYFCHFIFHFPGMRNIEVLKAKGWYGIQEDGISSIDRNARSRILREEASVFPPRTLSTSVMS